MVPRPNFTGEARILPIGVPLRVVFDIQADGERFTRHDRVHDRDEFGDHVMIPDRASESEGG